MSLNETKQNKSSVLSELEFDDRTRRRAQWEAFAFTVIAENQVEVRNESHADPADHTYRVTVEQRSDGKVRPLHCTCPAFQHHAGDCKHIVAAAIRDVVLGAAVAYVGDRSTEDTADDPIVLADGGRIEEADPDSAERDCVSDDDWCPGPNADDLPCFSCYRARDHGDGEE